MLVKGRTESEELLALRSLNTRMELSEKDQYHYLNLEKGFEGELKFDQLTENLQEERYIINDLLLEWNKSYFQIDSLIISQAAIHLFEIKNFENDYYLEGDKLYTLQNHREVTNPLDQLKRCSTLFRKLVQNLKLNYLVESSVIFINPEFTLFQAPKDLPIILPTQLNRFLKDFNQTPSKLNGGHKQLAYKLLSLHQTKNPFTKLPEYSYEELKKGPCCKNCKSFKFSIKNYDLVCDDCGEHERIDLAIVRTVGEMRLLFPDQKITTSSIYDWCQLDLSKRTFSRVLKKYYTALGKTSDTYYK